MSRPSLAASGRQDANQRGGVFDPAQMMLRVQRELVSPNVWNGRHWRVKHRISQEWEHAIGGSLLDAFEIATGDKISFQTVMAAVTGPKKWNGYSASRRRVAVIREVPSARNFIRDDDNLRFSVKPLLDALKRQGYIRDDSRKWIELPMPEQRVSSDGKYWTEIQIGEPVGL